MTSLIHILPAFHFLSVVYYLSATVFTYHFYLSGLPYC